MTTARSDQASHETGFTMIEIVIAMFIGVLIFGALAAAMVNNNNSSLGNQRQTQLLSVLQQRIEYVHQVLSQNGFSAVALSSNPAQGSDASLPASPIDPNDFITPYVSGFVTSTSPTAERFLIENNYNVTSAGTIDGGTTFAEVLDVDPTNGKVAPVSYVDIASGTAYTSSSSIPPGDPYVTVYTYITRATTGVNASLSSCPAASGTGSTADDTRRVIVAARLYQPRADNIGSIAPQYTTTLVENPTPSNQCQASLRLGPNVP